jgi:AcrR family transcriptional regulator
MRTRTEKKAETRGQIKGAAREMLRSVAFPALKIGALTRAAGVATGTFYVHFANKEALLDELLAEFNEGLTGQLEAVWAEDIGSPEMLLRRVAGICLDAWSAEKALLEAFVRRAALDEDVSALRDGINPPVAKFLSDALHTLASQLGVRLDHPALVTQGILGLWTRVGLQYLFNPDVSRDAAIETLTQMTQGAVTALFLGREREELP